MRKREGPIRLQQKRERQAKSLELIILLLTRWGSPSKREEPGNTQKEGERQDLTAQIAIEIADNVIPNLLGSSHSIVYLFSLPISWELHIN